ncbi:cation:proton antiporter [Deinococcus aerophilus]|uniref:Sodium/hydrogen antiporter n=1 Tax=Deinococcus aerophilus TaxID=522488 RepID=A0ABQ2GVB3_9DEIO|nr:sodium:proton antiporter [Deinococcus aerophilus]GGM13323.1 sodium/hydrogen antiporter [Deinococcus aerophilus]
MLHLEEAVVALPVMVALGLAAQVLAARLRVPAILPLLLVGFLVGPVLHWISPGTALRPQGLSVLTSLAVGVILFEGGLTLKFADIRGLGRAVRRLVGVGAGITWGLSALAAHLIVGLPWGVAALFGALVIVTGPTVIAPLLRNIRPNAKVAGVLRWEGILIDPVGALAAAIAFEWVRTSGREEALSATLVHLGSFVGVGLAVGVVMGGALAVVLRREWLPEHLVNPSVLAWVLLALGISDSFAPESGLLSTTLMGLIVANARVPQAEGVLHFKEELVVVLLSTIFVALAANVPAEALGAVFTPGPLLLLLAMVLVVRPASVLLSTLGTSLNLRERLFISYVGPRGIVAAAISALFAERLTALGVPGAETLLTLVFAVIVGTVILASLTARPVARALNVLEAEPFGYLIVGAHPLGRELAAALKAENVEVLLADTNRNNIAQARLEGLRSHYGTLLGEAADRLSLEGLGHLLALTPNDEANALSAAKYRREFGKANVFQLQPRGADQRTRLQEAERATSAFLHAPTFDELQERHQAGERVRRTGLTEEYTLEDFRRDQPGATLLLAGRGGQFSVLTGTEVELPPETTVISLGPPDEGDAAKRADPPRNPGALEGKLPG